MYTCQCRITAVSIQPTCLHTTHCPYIACTCIYAAVHITHRCSGDFNQAKQTKDAMGLPPLSQKAISANLPGDLTDMERAVAASPGMFGRIWYGQGLAFDEAYQILM